MSDYLTTAEAAALLRESPATTRRRLHDGSLRAGVHFVRPPHKHPLFVRAALVAWIEGRSVQGPRPRRERVNWDAVA